MGVGDAGSNASERDERLGEAIEAYLALAESGDAPDPDEFAARHPDLSDDLREALEGLAMVQGLVGDPRTGGGSTLEAGRRVAGYRIVRELGRGGMGIVYEAVHVDLDRPVALKVLGHEAAPDSRGRRRFLNEARTAAGLHHTHIVPVFDVGRVGGLCYYAMQRIEGSGLDRVVKHLRKFGGQPPGSDRSNGRRSLPGWLYPPDSATEAARSLGQHPTQGSFDRPSLTDATASWSNTAAVASRRAGLSNVPDEQSVPFDPPSGSAYFRWVVQVGRQASDALAYAHRRGVIHRDIKPSNLLVDSRGNVWIADFGLAHRITDPGLSQSHAAGPVGTPRYMSPEQAAGSSLDPRTDVYSLGSTLYELLTLRPPFDGSTSAEVIDQIRQKDPVPPRRFNPRIPRDLETIVLKAMAKRPADRYESAESLADDLARFLVMEPVKARRIGPVGRFIRFAHRHPYSTTVSITAALTVLSVATWAYVSVWSERNTALEAQKQAQDALTGERKARAEGNQARANELATAATVMRLSALPASRRNGLNLIRESARLTADLDLRARLRSEALAFYSLRDLEPRDPVPTRPNSETVFLANAPKPTLAILDESGDSLAFVPVDAPASRRDVVIETDPTMRGRRTQPLRLPGPNGMRIGSRLGASGGTLSVLWPNGRGVRRLSATDGSRIDDLPMPEHRIEGIKTAPDGRRMVTIEDAGDRRNSNRMIPPLRVVLWDTTHSGEARQLSVLSESAPGEEADRPGRFFEVPLVAISPDSNTVAVAWFNAPPTEESTSTIQLFHAETGEEASRVTGVPTSITSLALGTDRLLAAALTDGTIRIWEGSANTPLPGLYHHQSMVRSLKFSPDGTLLALAGSNNGIEVTDVATNTVVGSVRSSSAVSDLRFSPRGTELAAISGQSIALWTIARPMGHSVLSGFSNRVRSLAFGPGGRLVVSDWNNQVRLWAHDAGACTGRILSPIRHSGSLVFDKNGALHSVDAEGLDLMPLGKSSDDGFLRFANAQPPRNAALEPVSPFRLLGQLQAPAFIGGAGIAVQGTMLDVIRRTPRRFPFWIAVANSPSANRLAVARESDIFLWDYKDPTQLKRVLVSEPPTDPNPPGNPHRDRDHDRRRPHESPSVGPFPQGPAGRGGQANPSGTNGSRVRMPSIWTSLVLGPNGEQLFLLDSDFRLHAWKLDEQADGTISADPLSWSGIERGFTSMGLSADGKLLACGREPGNVYFLDPETGAYMGMLSNVSGDSPSKVTALALSPNAHLAAIGDQQGTFTLWALPDWSNRSRTGNAQVPTRILSFPSHLGSVGPVAFDPSGKRLASTAEDKVVQIWELDQIEAQLDSLGLGWSALVDGFPPEEK